MEYNKVQMYSHDNKTNFVVDGVRPVSYTHLDVYKRQQIIDTELKHDRIACKQR